MDTKQWYVYDALVVVSVHDNDIVDNDLQIISGITARQNHEFTTIYFAEARFMNIIINIAQALVDGSAA